MPRQKRGKKVSRLNLEITEEFRREIELFQEELGAESLTEAIRQGVRRGRNLEQVKIKFRRIWGEDEKGTKVEIFLFI